MKHAKYLLVPVITLALSIPVGMTAFASDPDPSKSPEVSGSETPEASDVESPEPSESPKVSETPEASESPEASETPEASNTPKASQTVKPSKTPEREDRIPTDKAQGNLGKSGEHVPVISVPADLEDDVAELASGDDDLLGIDVSPASKSVEVKYQLRAKLFGFIDVPYELQARVEAKDGEMNVKAKGPWWLIFARDNAGDVQDALEADPTLTEATNQGTVLSTIIGILKTLAGKGE